MDYEAMARELLQACKEVLKSEAARKLTGSALGEPCVLGYLQTHGGLAYPKELSRYMSVSTARIAALLRQMEQKGDVRREDDPEDDRQTLVRLTDIGAARADTQREEALRLTVKLLCDLGEDDAENCVRLFKKMAAMPELT